MFPPSQTAHVRHALPASIIASSLLALSLSASAQEKSRPIAPGSTSSTPALLTAKAATSTGEDGALVTGPGELTFSSRTYVRFFRQKYLLDPGAQLPVTETLVPIYEQFSMRADGLAAPWQGGTLQVRMSAWGLVDTVDVSQGQRLQGDLTAALVTATWDRSHITLGRQVTSNRAMPLARFDGVSAEYGHPSGMAVSAYGGLVAQPRFASRPEYVLLGSRADSLLRTPTAFDVASPLGYWVLGAGVSFFKAGTMGLKLGVHEERERGDLSRRWFTSEATFEPARWVTVGGSAAADMDTLRLPEARAHVDLVPNLPFGGSIEFLHSSPALFLSRASVLSVFSLSTFSEAGGELYVKPTSFLHLGASAHHVWSEGEPGNYRLGTHLRAKAGTRHRATGEVRYSRVSESTQGYHAVRAAFVYQPPIPLRATAEAQRYFYDVAIRGASGATYGSLTLEYDDPRTLPVRVLLGGVVSESPLTDVEYQGMLRISYDLSVTLPRRK